MSQVSRVRPGESKPSADQESEPEAQPKATKRYTIATTDSDGAPQQGVLVFADGWSPELGQFDPSDTEAFRIVIPGQARTIPHRDVAPGVSVCIPSADRSPLRSVRETATTYKTKRAPDQTTSTIEEFTLSPSEIASLASGQLLANPSLDLTPTDVFPTGEPTPHLELLAQALLDQKKAQPYVYALAVALAAPAEPEDGHELRPLLQCLRQVVLAADKALEALETPGASVADLRSDGGVHDRLTRVARADTATAFADVAAEIYASPVDLGEDIYLYRALLDSPENAMELVKMRSYLGDAMVPETAGSELALDRTLAAEQLSFAVLVAERQRWAGIRAAFERFHRAYRAAYLEHHCRYWEGAMMLHAQLMDFTPHAQALRRLNSLRELGKPLGERALADYEELPQRIGACMRATRLDRQLWDCARCPECGLSMTDDLPWESVQRVKHHLQRALDQQLHRLSSKAVRQVLTRSGEARVQEFIQIVQASQVQSLSHVLDDELLCFLRRFLVEARVHSLIAPLLAKLQNITPDVDDEMVEAVTAKVGEIIQDAFADTQRALPKDVRPQLGPGTDPEDATV